MTALSIHLSSALAKASQEVAKELGISRTELIRQALTHELENFYAQQEREGMAKSFAAMRKDPVYQKEVNEIEQGFNDNLFEDGDEWWSGKK